MGRMSKTEEKVEEKTPKKKPFLYRVIFKLVVLFYRKYTYVGLENLPKEPSLVIINHAQIHAPLSVELYFPTKKSMWCIGQMMNVKEIPAYAYQDFWSLKPKCVKWFYKLLSYAMAPLASFVLSNADTMPVYKDARILTTFRKTLEHLNAGDHVVLCPEKADAFNEIVNEFQDKFVDVARLYYSRYKREIAFVPTYCAPALKTVVFGKPIYYDPSLSMDEQRKKVCDYLKAEITALAKELPRHKVVPYLNISKKKYPYSK